MVDPFKSQQIKDRANWLAYYARDLAAVIGASDPNEYTGWQAALDRAEADIAEIRRRAKHHANKHMEAAE